MLPGRANFFPGLTFQVVLDYAHNPEGLETMCRFLATIDVIGRRRCILMSGGFRVDEQIIERARVLADHFDHFMLYTPGQLFGRNSDEIPRLLRQGLSAEGVTNDRIEFVGGEEKAVDYALRSAEAGDLLVLFANNLDRARRQVEAVRDQNIWAV